MYLAATTTGVDSSDAHCMLDNGILDWKTYTPTYKLLIQFDTHYQLEDTLEDGVVSCGNSMPWTIFSQAGVMGGVQPYITRYVINDQIRMGDYSFYSIMLLSPHLEKHHPYWLELDWHEGEGGMKINNPNAINESSAVGAIFKYQPPYVSVGGRGKFVFMMFQHYGNKANVLTRWVSILKETFPDRSNFSLATFKALNVSGHVPRLVGADWFIIERDK